MTASTPYDTILIGAGMSGLAAGIRLAQFDQRVLVLDRHYLWGGLNSYYKREGRRFDVGLHALTNFVPKGTRGRPLTRILRQLRIPYDSLRLGEQHGSRSVVGDTDLRFGNDFELLRSEVARQFPTRAAAFDGMARELEALPFDVPEGQESARAYLTRHLGEARLVDLLLLPILFYGSPTPSDIDFPSFVVLWKSLYEEGFARPRGGIRPLLDALRSRYLELGGELRMKAGVAEILHEDGRVQGVRLDDGTEIRSERVISSAGRVETLSLCEETVAATCGPEDAGRMTFVESTTLLDQPAPDLGWTDTIVFFSQGERAVYEEPAEAVSHASGVICCPENYAGQEPESEGVLRLTLMANAEHWKAMSDGEYLAAKEQAWSKGLETAALYGPDVREQVVAKDTFTPRTIERFTGHLNGAVYGCPHKDKSGTTPLEGLFLCGTDQGYLGIVGAMLSGVAMANRHALVPA